jgi:hypothetical protein
LFDSNVLLDIATADPVWLAWAERQFREAAAQGLILVNGVNAGDARHRTLPHATAPAFRQ